MSFFDKLKNNIGTSSLNKVGTGPLNMDSLKSAKDSTSQRDSDRKDNYNELYSESLVLIDKFLQNPEKNISYLKEAAFKLVDSLALVKDKPEPYLLMAYIFYMMGDVVGALKYIKVCSDISPNFFAIDEMKKLISGESSEVTSQKIQFSTSPVREENVSPAISTLQKSGPPKSIQRITRIEKK